MKVDEMDKPIRKLPLRKKEEIDVQDEEAKRSIIALRKEKVIDRPVFKVDPGSKSCDRCVESQVGDIILIENIKRKIYPTVTLEDFNIEHLVMLPTESIEVIGNPQLPVENIPKAEETLLLKPETTEEHVLVEGVPFDIKRVTDKRSTSTSNDAPYKSDQLKRIITTWNIPCAGTRKEERANAIKKWYYEHFESGETGK